MHAHVRTHADDGYSRRPIPAGAAAFAATAWLASAGATAVHAQPLDGVEIEWSGPPACAEDGGVKAAVAEFVGPDFRAKGEASFAITVEPERGGGFAIDLRAEGDAVEGERRLTVTSCKEAHDVVALLVAIALDPEAALRAQVQAPEPWTSPEPALHPWGAVLGAGVVLDTNSLPGVALAPELRLAWDLGLVRAGVRGRVYLPRTAQRAIAGTSDVGEVSVTLWSGVAEACVMARFEHLAVGPCAGFEAGSLRGAGGGDGVAMAEDDSSAWFAVAAGGELDLALSDSIGLDLQLGAALPLRHTRFAVRPDQELHQTDPASVRAALGIVFRLPP